jgi:ABC-type nitrate/sulfonate/bicarbonate transport system permease component
MILLTLFNELSTILVIYWAAQWPILNNTASGAKNVNPIYIKVAKAAKIDNFDIFWKIQLRSSLPNIFTGLRLGVLFGFLISFGVEMMGMTTGKGLGYFIMQSQMNGQTPYIWVGITTMTILSLLITLSINQTEKYFSPEKKYIKLCNKNGG